MEGNPIIVHVQSHPFTLFINDRLEEKRMDLLEQLYAIPISEWRSGISGTQKLPEWLLPQLIQTSFMTLQHESSFIMVNIDIGSCRQEARKCPLYFLICRPIVHYVVSTVVLGSFNRLLE
jgi:hypothetical protein